MRGEAWQRVAEFHTMVLGNASLWFLTRLLWVYFPQAHRGCVCVLKYGFKVSQFQRRGQRLWLGRLQLTPPQPVSCCREVKGECTSDLTPCPEEGVMCVGTELVSCAGVTCNCSHKVVVCGWMKVEGRGAAGKAFPPSHCLTACLGRGRGITEWGCC